MSTPEPPWPICSILGCYIPTILFFASFTYGWHEGGNSTGRGYVALLYGVPGTIGALIIAGLFHAAAERRREDPFDSISFRVALLILIAASLTYCHT